MSDFITPSEFHTAQGTADWRVLGEGAHAFFRTGSMAEAARLVTAIGAIPGVDGEGNVPEIDVRKSGVTVRLLTKQADGYGMSTRDVELARAISSAARSLGLSADPSVVRSFLVVPGAADTAAVMPFWQAVLGFVPRPDSPEEDLVDPQDRLPGFWFEEMREPRGDQGGAIHVAIWLPHELAEQRVQAALAAGGHLVRDKAPMWWTLADSAGNEVDVATVKGRD
jgi:4a-hydroxytetrahydrobiopterin dehydratase